MILSKFKSKKELEEQLCNDIIESINNAIEEYGCAHILLSGGSTPLDLYKKIGWYKLDGEKVKVGLVDERYVPEDSEHCNERNITEAMRRSYSQTIKIIPLSIEVDNPDLNLELAEECYEPFFERIDFCLLGMGEDGHTASLFPGDEASAKLLNQEESEIGYTHSPNFPEERISCNKHMLLQSDKLALMLIGEKKLEILNSAEEKKLPISHFMNTEKELNVYFSEK